MKDKTKEQLINELVELRQRIAELEELIKPKGRPNKDVKEGTWNRLFLSGFLIPHPLAAGFPLVPSPWGEG